MIKFTVNELIMEMKKKMDCNLNILDMDEIISCSSDRKVRPVFSMIALKAKRKSNFFLKQCN